MKRWNFSVLCLCAGVTFLLPGSQAFFAPAVNCSVIDSCSLHHLLPSNQNPNCECDEYCAVFNDCCHDMDKNIQILNIESLVDIQESLQCRKLYSIDAYKSILVVGTCPAGYPRDDIVQGCEVTFEQQMAALAESDNINDTIAQIQWLANDVLFTQVPVSSNRTTVLYKNVYCALCHQEYDFTLWNMKIYRNYPFNASELDDTEALVAAYRSAREQQVVQHLPTRGIITRDCQSTVNTCSTDWTDDDIRQECHRYQSYTFHTPSRKIFRNKNCALCNDVDPSTTSCRGPQPFLYARSSYGPKFPSYSLLFDFHTGESTIGEKVGWEESRTVVKLAPDSCSEAGKLYDPFQGLCRYATCPSGYQMKHGECIYDLYEEDLCEEHHNGTSNSSCFNTTYQQPATWAYASGTAEGYLTLVGSLLSILGLIIHITVYCCLAPLRNLPGKCMICLSASLLVSQLLFIFGTGRTDTGWCLTISLFLHFGFLAYFCWMGVLAFDVWRAFTVTTQTSQATVAEDNRRQFILYSLYAWLTPAIIVSLSAILDETTSAVRPMYAEHICWVGSKLGLLVLFSVPIGLILLVNMVFFVLTSRYIYKTKKSARVTTGNTLSQQRDRFCLYLKLCTIMGLTWLFGFIAAFMDVPAIWYIYIILNTLQGVFICISFVFTRKVMKLMTEKLQKYRPGRSLLPTYSSTHTLSTRQTTLVSDSSHNAIKWKSRDLELKGCQEVMDDIEEVETEHADGREACSKLNTSLDMA